MNYTTPNQTDVHYQERQASGNASADLLDLFAEELPKQHDMRMPLEPCTLASLSSVWSCVGTASTLSC